VTTIAKRKHESNEISFSAPRLPREWVDCDPNEVPAIVAQALRDRAARASLHLSSKSRLSALAEVLA
jgi:hypothetical protein